MSHKIRKAVIPAAGLGTRFLPATKTIPKEMLPIVDRPILLYVVEEAARAGIQDIVLIQGRGKGAIEDFFDTSYELEATLEQAGKLDWLSEIRRIRDLANIITVRQKVPLGLGHAVLTAEPVVGHEPFAVLLGDEIMLDFPNHPSAIAQLIALHEEHKKSAVAIMEVPPEQVHKYGIVGGPTLKPGLIDVNVVVEKPRPDDAPSRWALPGRYVFNEKIFSYLRDARPGKNGEIQLTDAMTDLAKNVGMIASTVHARRFDAGDKFGFLQANIELALERTELKDQLIPYLKSLAHRLEKGPL
jgi:UTP--glucose-1-phosphate uridylyltransferase